jgi:disulfide bond formation protein DsbB
VTARLAVLAAAGGSAALLAAAYAFQHIGGLAPCPICLWQRWPHALALGVGAVAYTWPIAPLAGLGALAAAITAGLGVYHTGIERSWWPGPTTCSGGGQDLSALSGADLLSTDGAGAVVMCDDVVWSLAGLSMASWNAVLSIALVGLWLVALRRALSGS